MLKKILEKKKVWVSLALGVSLCTLLLILFDIILTLQQLGSEEVVRPLVIPILVSGVVEYVVTLLYYIYRLLYLYKGTEKRALWTVLTIAGLVMSEVDSILMIGEMSLICVLGIVILLACWVHDIWLVFVE